MDERTAHAAAHQDLDLDLVSVDSTTARAHHHAAGTRVDPYLLGDLDKALTEEKGIRQLNEQTS